MRKLSKKEARKQAAGTHFVGELDTSYSNIVGKFGPPNFPSGDGYKVDAEWILKDKGHVITIYNYKTGHNYLGRRGKDTTKIRDWHIGGSTGKVIDIIRKYFPNSKVTKGYS